MPVAGCASDMANWWQWLSLAEQAVSKKNIEDVENVLKESSVYFDQLGVVLKDNFILLGDDKISIDELAKHNKNWLMEYMTK